MLNYETPNFPNPVHVVVNTISCDSIYARGHS